MVGTGVVAGADGTRAFATDFRGFSRIRSLREATMFVVAFFFADRTFAIKQMEEKRSPTLAEDARAGFPATRLVYLGGGSSPHFSGCDLAMTGGGQ
jgi:hypothetical protein